MKILGWFLLALYSPHAFADQAENEHRTVLTPTMAVFYVIDSEGRSVRELPVVAVISGHNVSASSTGMRSRPSLKRKARRKRGPSRVVSIRVIRTSHDARDAYRCEQHGLYYTTDGRCILPTLRGKRSP
jgi:hypothetical protein